MSFALFVLSMSVIYGSLSICLSVTMAANRVVAAIKGKSAQEPRP